MKFLVLLGLLGVAFAANTTSPVPVVLWHGMGDTCCNPLSMGSIKRTLEKNIDGVYVLSLEIGDSVVADEENGFLMNVNDQVDLVCQTIAADANLQNGYNSIGFSQGGQFLRAVAQRCPNPPMKNFISVGGQHQGVYGFPHCTGSTYLCNTMRQMLNMGAYVGFVQDNLAQAEYWHDPMDEETYRAKSVFIAEINNENEINQDYVNNLMALENFVMVKFTQDTMVAPPESEWFGFYDEGSSTDIHTLQDSDLYNDDKLGLKQMDAAGKLAFLSIDADHLQMTEDFFVNQIINVYLK